MTKYPPAPANIRYNVPPPRDEPEEGEPQYFDTTMKLDGDVLEEMDVLRPHAFFLFNRLREELRIPMVNEIHNEILDENLSFDNPRLDRSLEFALQCPALAPHSIVELVQRELLREFPLWRFLICHETEEDLVAIYPDAVSIGADPAGPLSVEAWEKWHRHVLALEERSYGPMRRQFQFVKDQVMSRLADVGPSPVRIIGVFDNWRGDRQRHHLWLLASGPSTHLFLMNSPADAGHGESYAVNKAGEIGLRFGAGGVKSPYFLESWVYEDPQADVDIVINRVDDNAAWVTRIPLSEVIRDDVLAAGWKGQMPSWRLREVK
jgi:hypothetical protein